jgi:hypothetical protein
VNNHLCITVRRKNMTTTTQLLSQLHVVVNLTIQNNHNRIILIEDRLITRLQIDDSQPLHTKTDTLIQKDATRIRTTMPHHVTHRLHQFPSNGTLSRDLAGNPTHPQPPTLTTDPRGRVLVQAKPEGMLGHHFSGHETPLRTCHLPTRCYSRDVRKACFRKLTELVLLLA